jgi:hypothetical protein
MMLKVRDTLVPLIFMSDGTQLSNSPDDKKASPAYMTIANLSWMIPQLPSTHSVVIVTLLPIQIKNLKSASKCRDEQQQKNRKVLKEVLRRVLLPLTFTQNPSSKSGCYNVLCADGNFRHSKPVIAAWHEECPGYCNLHHLEWHICVWCECPKNELADNVPPDKEHPQRDHNNYRMLSDANTKAADGQLSLHHILQGFNMC